MSDFHDDENQMRGPSKRGLFLGYVEALVLGLVQGLTEFLPVSSSGHLALGHLLFGYDGEAVVGAKAFDVLLHVATLLVVFGVFWRNFRRLLQEDFRLWPRFAVALVPTAAVGFLLRKEIEALDHKPWALAGFFVLTGSILWLAEKYSAKPQETPAGDDPAEKKSDFETARTATADLRRVGWRSAFLVGAAQAAAILPGVSRSGSTIATGRLTGLSPADAVTFSFVLGAPAILGAAMLKARDIEVLATLSPGPLAVGFAAAFASGWLALSWLRRLAAGGKLSRFTPYCFLLAVLCAWVAATKTV